MKGDKKRIEEKCGYCISTTFGYRVIFRLRHRRSTTNVAPWYSDWIQGPSITTHP